MAAKRAKQPAAAKKRAKKSQTRTGGRTGAARPTRKREGAIDGALARLERDVPRLLRQLRGSVQDMQRQVDRARADGEKRWREAERKLRRDAVLLRQRLERTLGRVGRKAATTLERGAGSRAGRKRGASGQPAKSRATRARARAR